MPNGLVKIKVANEPVRLVNVSTLIEKKDFHAASTNAGDIFIGGEFISSYENSNIGDRLESADIYTLENVNLMDYWIVGANVGDYIHW